MAVTNSPHRYALLVVVLSAVSLLLFALQSKLSRPQGNPSQSATVMSWEHFKLDEDAQSDLGGIIAVGRNDDGLVIRGVLHGAPPQWSKVGQSLDWNDHVEIWLADGAPTRLPVIGWGNQFEYLSMSSAADIPAYANQPRDLAEKMTRERLAWYQRQLPYRDLVKRLFQRRWRLAPGHSEEFYASDASAKLAPGDRKDLAPLMLRGAPEMTADPRSDGSTFEILIPWEAFPPVQSLLLQDLRLMVVVVDTREGNQANRRHRLRDAEHRSEDVLLPLRLSSAREYTLTPFRFAMTDAMLAADIPYTPSDDAVRYIRPSHDTILDTVVVLDNTSQGYQFEPGTDSRSPIAQEARFWIKPIAGHGLLAGPRLSWMRDNLITRSDEIVGDPHLLDLRAEANGDLLLRHGPFVWWSRFGSGQCGACPRIGVDLFLLRTREHAITNLVSYYDVIDGDGDITLSPDWRTISGFRTMFDPERKDDAWYRIDHIRAVDGMRYDELKPRPVSGPPQPRTLVPGRQ